MLKMVLVSSIINRIRFLTRKFLDGDSNLIMIRLLCVSYWIMIHNPTLKTSWCCMSMSTATLSRIYCLMPDTICHTGHSPHQVVHKVGLCTITLYYLTETRFYYHIGLTFNSFLWIRSPYMVLGVLIIVSPSTHFFHLIKEI